MPQTKDSVVGFGFLNPWRSKAQDSKTVEEEVVKLDYVTITKRRRRDDVIEGKAPLRKLNRGLLYSGLLCILVASILLFLDPIGAISRWQTTFSKGTFIYNIWKRPPANGTLMFYIFNYTNTEAFLRGDEKLKMEEIGPYVYHSFADYLNVTFNSNETFTYVPKAAATFDPINTVGDPGSDVITVPNLALLGMTSYLAESSLFTNMGFNVFANYIGSTPFLTMTVDDFLWGYDEPLLDYASKIMPSAIPFNKIGFLSMFMDHGDHVTKLNSNTKTKVRSDGRVIIPLTIDTFDGSAGLPHYGYVEEDNSTHLECNTLQGAVNEGSRIARKVNIKEPCSLYNKQLCRIFPYVFGNYSHTKWGVPAIKFHFKEDMYQNSLPENSCFCDKDKGPCLPDGLTDASPCFFDMPIALSNPHFLFGDPKLAEAWDALSPDKEKHSSYALMEKEIGVLMAYSFRVQVNLAMKNTRYNPKVEPLKNMVLPMYWVDSVLDEIPLSYHLLLYMVVIVIPIANNVVIAMLFLAGMASVAVYCARYIRYHHFRRLQ